jgi:hypothetical protein
MFLCSVGQDGHIAIGSQVRRGRIIHMCHEAHTQCLHCCSMLATESLEQATMSMPNCQYSVRSGTLNGPAVRYVRVGDMLVHRWECDNREWMCSMRILFCSQLRHASQKLFCQRRQRRVRARFGRAWMSRVHAGHTGLGYPRARSLKAHTLIHKPTFSGPAQL